MGFRSVVQTSVTWNEGFVSQRCGEDGVSDYCSDLCDMDLGVLCHRGVVKIVAWRGVAWICMVRMGWRCMLRIGMEKVRFWCGGLYFREVFAYFEVLLSST